MVVDKMSEKIDLGKFKPALFPNEELNVNDIDDKIYLVTPKLDGMRCIFHPKLGMVSRSLKVIPNKQLNEKYKHIVEYSKEHDVILDGEIYQHGMEFKDIISHCRKADKECPEELKFHCFDILDQHNDEYYLRLVMLDLLELKDIEKVPVTQVKGKIDMVTFFEYNMKRGYEGVMIRDGNSKYKFGRYTYKSADAYKFKPFETIDGEIVEVIQAKVVKDGVERTINELGRSVTSKKKDDRVLIQRASAFRVRYEDTTVKVPLAMTNKEKDEVWKHRELYIGRWIEYKYQPIGMVDKPRIPKFGRFRVDLDE